MENGDKTAECLEMAAVQEGNHTPAADDIDWCVHQVDCLCQGQFVNYYPMILNCCHRVVPRQIGHTVVPYLLSLVEILSSTSSVMKDGGNLL